MASKISGGLKDATPESRTLDMPSSKQKPAKNSSNPNEKSSSQKRPSSHHTEQVFAILLSLNVLAAMYSPIQDCDEVFNYWEPTHYLNYRYGLQTWEYAPEFSLRSWLYIVVHSVFGKVGSFLSSNKSFEFYFIRVILAVVCTLSETRLIFAISSTLNPRIGIIFGLVIGLSPGMFHASVAYLPSSFAMYAAMLGAAAFMNWRGGLKSAEGIMWFGIGGIVGWPFAVALIIPFAAEDLFLAALGREWSELIYRYLDGIVRCVIVLVSKWFLGPPSFCDIQPTQALQVSIDTFFYHKIVVMPWRIVMYNVFGDSRRGPSIFGTEPWDFYVRNLLLNFNVWFLLALFAGPMLVLNILLRSQSMSKRFPIRYFVFTIPFYLWLAIFSLQPHKEERFMYPAYPFLCLNAAIALHILLSYIGDSGSRNMMGKIPGQVKLAIVSIFMLGAATVSILRTAGVVSAYRAPLHVYGPLKQYDDMNSVGTVCLSKEWYRFPSSYFLPNGMRAKFVKSAFDGLLPGEFNEAKTGFGLFPGTWLDPPGMNDMNIEDYGKYVSILKLVYFPLSRHTILTTSDRHQALFISSGFLFPGSSHNFFS